MNYLDFIREIEKLGLIPNSKKVGEFIKSKEGEDKLKFLEPANWVFHPQIVECVVSGEYGKIKPVCAEFVPTLNCSNRCKICGYKLAKQLEGCWEKRLFIDSDCHLQSVELGLERLDKLFDCGVKGIIFTGGGEPFLFKDLEALIHHCSIKGIDSVVYTNGNSLSPERVRRVIEASPLLARVSLNAGKEEIYNKFHNPFAPGAFYRALRTTKEFAIGARENPKMTFGVGVVINEINQDDLVETARRLREITDSGGRIDFIAYRPEFNYYGGEQLPDELLDRTYEIIEKQVKKILNGTGIKVSNFKGRYDALKQDTRTYIECRAAGICAEISPSGVYFCCDRNLNRKYLIGDLDNEDLDSIYSGVQRDKILKKVKKSRCRICPPACKSHETNLQFQQIEDLRARGEFYKARAWIEMQRKMTKPKMVNFP